MDQEDKPKDQLADALAKKGANPRASLSADERAKLDENWKYIHEKERGTGTSLNTCFVELNERLKELESQKHLVEQAKQEKKNLNSELEALKRETLTLKRVKDQLF